MSKQHKCNPDTAGAETDAYADHTLVVTTYNRPEMLAGLLSFVADEPPVGRVLVIDGSDDACHVLNRDAVARLAGNQRVELARAPAELDVLRMYAWAVRAVDTPFMTLVHDDNLVLLDCVRDSVRLLRKRPGHVVCAGRIAYAGASGRTATVSVADAASIEDDDPLRRVLDFIRQYWSIDFGTWRTEARRGILDGLSLYPLDEAVAEPMHNAMAAVAGRFAVLDRIGPIFRVHDDNNMGRTIANRLGFASPRFREAIEAGAALLARLLAAKGAPAPDNLPAMLAEAFVDHVAAYDDLFADGIAPTVARTVDSGSTMEAFRASVLAARPSIRVALLDPHLSRPLPEPQLQEPPAHPEMCGHRRVIELHRGLVTTYRTESVAYDDTGLRHPARLACRAAVSDTTWTDHVATYVGGAGSGLADPGGNNELSRRAVLLGALALELRPAATRNAFRALDVDPHSEGGARQRRDLARAAQLIGAQVGLPGIVMGEPMQFVSARPNAPVAPVDGILDVAEARTANGTTLVPLRWAHCADSADPGVTWLRARVRLTCGKLQIGVLADGDFHGLIAVEPRDAEQQTVYLPVVRGRSELVVLRDLSSDDAPLAGGIEQIDVVVPVDAGKAEPSAQSARRAA